MGPDNLGGGTPATQERFAGSLGYRGGRRDTALPDEPEHGRGSRGGFPLPGPLPINGSTGLDGSDDLDRSPTLTSMDLGGLSEPVYPPRDWLGPSGGPALVDHPLLRGLLMELPPKGSAPPPGWLDRWFEAAQFWNCCILTEIHPVPDNKSRMIKRLPWLTRKYKV
jgi:hypothetical protein